MAGFLLECVAGFVVIRSIGPTCEVLAVCLSFADGSGTATFCFVAETWGMAFRGAALPNAGARAVKFPIHGPTRIATGSTGI